MSRNQPRSSAAGTGRRPVMCWPRAHLPTIRALPIALCPRRFLHGEARCMVVNDWRTDRLLMGDGSLLGFEI